MARVLIVDDNKPFTEAMAAVLRSDPSFEVSLAYDGEMAVRMASELSPAVVVMDVEMPGMDGREVTRRILASAAQNGSRPSVVAMSSFTHHEDDMLAAGASMFLSKERAFEVITQVKTIVSQQ